MQEQIKSTTPLDDHAEAMLWFLESNPSERGKILEYFDEATAKMLAQSRMVHYQSEGELFFITHRGISFLRERGRGRKVLAELSWKHNIHEMTADRAIELFAPQTPSPLITAEGVLVNESPRKPKFQKVKAPTYAKSKHLPKKPKTKKL
jgi:hypothetical protein